MLFSGFHAPSIVCIDTQPCILRQLFSACWKQTHTDAAFPSLSAAMAHVKAKQQPAQKASRAGGSSRGAAQSAEAAAQEELSLLLTHWPVTEGQQPTVLPATASSGSTLGSSTLTAYIAYEYETLDGRRFFATPQQLGSNHKDTVLRQGTFSGGTGASSSGPARFLLTHDVPLWLELPPRSARHLSQLTPHCAPAAIKLAPAADSVLAAGSASAAGTATAAGASQGAGGASQEGGGAGPTQGGARGAARSQVEHDPNLGLAAVANAAAAADAATPLPMRHPHMAQLQRIFMCTPPTTHARLACKPAVHFKVMGSTVLPDECLRSLVAEGPPAALQAAQPKGADGSAGPGQAAGSSSQPVGSTPSGSTGPSSSTVAASIPTVSNFGSTTPEGGSPAAAAVAAVAGSCERKDTLAAASTDAAQSAAAPTQPWGAFTVTLAQECVLPPDSLCVLCLPHVYAAPLFALAPSLGLSTGALPAAAAAASAHPTQGAAIGPAASSAPGAVQPNSRSDVVGARTSLAPVFVPLVEARLAHGAVFPRVPTQSAGVRAGNDTLNA